MCEFISMILTNDENPKIYWDTPTSHAETAEIRGLKPGSYVEAEWTGDGDENLTIRCDDGREAIYRACILADFKTYAQLVKAVLSEPIRGCLDLRDTGITALPEGLTVGGSLHLSGAGIKIVPRSAKIKGTIYR